MNTWLNLQRHGHVHSETDTSVRQLCRNDSTDLQPQRLNRLDRLDNRLDDRQARQ